METTIIDRIIEIANEESRSIRAFELSCGINSGYLGSMKGKNRSVGSSIILNILETYPKYSLEWIMTGMGPKYKLKEGDVVEPGSFYGQEPFEKLLCDYLEKSSVNGTILKIIDNHLIKKGYESRK
ncbi:hypothetical protein [Croceibacter atlanticus]|mgnify:CR=1 FL=1|uniref:hypothetical protein n=1 Tax=Croceibacter atlanticus TaxID=313588 RepID=UPI0030DAC308|tara:strand:- start:177 stop:554 length:378 start_codon:yes stop_codon:yes gene_type:complete